VLLKLAFDVFGLHRVIGRLEPRNTGSARVLERLGMRKEAHFVENEFVKGEWQSESSTRCWMGSGESDRPEHCPRGIIGRRRIV
jgi:hypothetical protein